MEDSAKPNLGTRPIRSVKKPHGSTEAYRTPDAIQAKKQFADLTVHLA